MDLQIQSSLYQKGKNRKALRIRACIPVRTYRWKFSYSIQIYWREYKRQEMLRNTSRRVCYNIRKKLLTIHRDRQRILQQKKCEKSSSNRSQGYWNPISRRHQKSPDFMQEKSKRSQGPPSWNGTLNRTREKYGTKKKQNDLGQSNFSFRVSVYNRFQSQRGPSLRSGYDSAEKVFSAESI